MIKTTVTAFSHPPRFPFFKMADETTDYHLICQAVVANQHSDFKRFAPRGVGFHGTKPPCQKCRQEGFPETLRVSENIPTLALDVGISPEPYGFKRGEIY